MNCDPKRLARLARAHESLARLLEARLLAEEATVRDIAAGRQAMEASSRLIPISFLPAALRGLADAEARQKEADESAAKLQQQRLMVEGRRRAVSAQMDIAHAQRERKTEEERVLESSLVMAKDSGKQAVLK